MTPSKKDDAPKDDAPAPSIDPPTGPTPEDSPGQPEATIGPKLQALLESVPGEEVDIDDSVEPKWLDDDRCVITAKNPMADPASAGVQRGSQGNHVGEPADHSEQFGRGTEDEDRSPSGDPESDS